MHLSPENGSVLIEWAIVVFGAILGMIMMVDLAVALGHYMSFTLVAREAARSAASVAEFEAGAFSDLMPTPAEKEACEEAKAIAFPCAHDFIQERTRFLIQQLDLSNIDPSSLSITTEFIPLATLGNEQDDTITVTIQANYIGSTFFIGLPLTVTHQGPYLFQR